MTVRMARGLTFLLLSFFTTVSVAAPNPYSDWSFDAKRANDKGDLDALGALVKANPHFGRIFFYGQVFDLVTDGVPKPVRDALQPRLEMVAKVLKQVDSSDDLPALFLDRFATGKLKADVEVFRRIQQSSMNLLTDNRLLALRLSTVENPQIVQAVFYSYLYRAELARPRLGGAGMVKTFLNLTRSLAEGFALIEGNLAPWRSLAAFQPKAGKNQASQFDIAVKGVVEQNLINALNQSVSVDAATAFNAMLKTYSTARAARGDNLLVALILNGVAHAAARAGDAPRARSYHQQVLQGVRSIKLSALNIALLKQIIEQHLSDKTFDAMRTQTAALRNAGMKALNAIGVTDTLERSAVALDDHARALIDDGKLSSSILAIDEATALFALLAKPEVAEIGQLQSDVPHLRYTRLSRQAKLLRLRGWTELRRGNFESAKSGFRASMDIFQADLNELVEASRSETALATAILGTGDWEKALAATTSALDRLGPDGDAATRAHTYLVQGWIRFTRGQLAKAYGNANYGLRVFKKATNKADNKEVHGRLHALAAAVLDGAGFFGDAAARIDYALRHQPQDPEIVRMAVVAKVKGGDLDGAISALEPLLGSEYARTATVWRGCILLRSGQVEEGLTMLRILVPQLTLPHLTHTNLVGRACLAYGYLKTNDIGSATATLAPALRRLETYPHPGLAWRIHALDGEIAAREGRILDAAGSLRQALDAYQLFLGERAWRGVSAAYQTLALPAEPTDYLSQLPDLLVRAGEKDKTARSAHRMAAVQVADWLRDWTTAPASRQFIAGGSSDANGKVHAQLARLDELRQILADSGVDARHRATVAQRYRLQVEAFREAVKVVRGGDSAALDFYAPVSQVPESGPDVALVRYRVQADATHLWLILAPNDVRHYMLPGQAKLAAIVGEVHRIIKQAPEKWDSEARRPKDPNAQAWSTLEKAAKTILPFVKERAVMAALTGRTLRITPDGPLIGLPFDALVLKKPDRRKPGTPPAYLGQVYAVQLAMPQHVKADGVTADQTVILGPLGDGAANCPVTSAGVDLCSAQRHSGLGAALTGIAGGQTAPKQLSGTALSSATLASSLKAYRRAIILSPIEFSSTSFGVSQTDGTTAKLSFESIANQGSGADEVFVVSAAFDALPAETGLSLRRLQNALMASGTGVLALNIASDANDSNLMAYLSPYLSDNRGLYDAIHSWKTHAMSMVHDVKGQGPVLHHPYYWGRWSVYSVSETTPNLIKTKSPTADNPYGSDDTSAVDGLSGSDAAETQTGAEPASTQDGEKPTIAPVKADKTATDSTLKNTEADKTKAADAEKTKAAEAEKSAKSDSN
ncbi:MAG: hypothetical protein VYA30_08195 [Myxococcota bacterium]|nr:hypothetical protein [Myxococcota bacterium]